jgi:CheY-like chemotaxis protein
LPQSSTALAAPVEPCEKIICYMTTRHDVLVVEDDADIRDAMVGILESEGYQVSAASHGAEALAQLQAGNRPCLILLDLMMPIMDGWAFCREKAKDPEYASIPIVVVSAITRQDPRNAGLHPVDHLFKPVDVNKLLATVGRYC